MPEEGQRGSCSLLFSKENEGGKMYPALAHTFIVVTSLFASTCVSQLEEMHINNAIRVQEETKCFC